MFYSSYMLLDLTCYTLLFLVVQEGKLLAVLLKSSLFFSLPALSISEKKVLTISNSMCIFVYSSFQLCLFPYVF